MAVAELKTPTTPTGQTAFRRILVATDFSKASRRALSEALALAVDNDARVSVAHVLRSDWRYEMLESPPEIDLEQVDAEQRLKALIHEMDADGKVDATLVKHGSVTSALVSIIAESQADLLVMGTRGRGGFSKLALGSVAEELLRVAPCPVLTIGPNATWQRTARRISFHSFCHQLWPGIVKSPASGVDPGQSEPSQTHPAAHVLAYARDLGQSFLVCASTGAADELVAWEGSSRKRSLQQLKGCLPSQTSLHLEPVYVVGTDFLPEGILTAASKFKVDLIVMGANHKGSARAAAHTPWSAVHEVICNAPAPY